MFWMTWRGHRERPTADASCPPKLNPNMYPRLGSNPWFIKVSIMEVMALVRVSKFVYNLKDLIDHF